MFSFECIVRTLAAWLICLSLPPFTGAIELDLSSASSIKSVSAAIAHELMSYYHGNETGQIPGLLPGPYYWWEAGAMFMEMIEYWYYTGDTTYNDVVMDALLFQVGRNNDYMPANQTKAEGNDDQAFWAFAAIEAAELNFPNPPADQPQWLALAQAVFNTQVERWDTTTCGGGLRWQIFTFNGGYDYKNTISNGGFFQLAARLARYTGNSTYADWAEKMYDWMENSPLLTDDWQLYDGSSTAKNCTDADQLKWTYNYGTFIAGCAYMYNYTNGSSLWGERLSGFLKGSGVFFPTQYDPAGNIMVEVACEVTNTCNVDQPSFKAYMARWMALATQLAPYTTDAIMPKLQASARGAAQQCVGPQTGHTCGRKWWQPTYDGYVGVGEQMSALSVIQSNLIPLVAPPVRADTGGTSPGDPSAGTGEGTLSDDPNYIAPPTTADKVGAGVLTAVVLMGTLGGAWWMSSSP